MKILFVGDVVGSLGVKTIEDYLPQLKQEHKPQVTIVNGENSANRGRGITEKIYKQLLNAGADVITLGNHAFDDDDIFSFMPKVKNIIRPANFPDETTPGKGIKYLNVNGVKLAVINVQGNAMMSQSLADPFETAKVLVEEARQETPCIFMDFHAETTSEKLAMGWYLDGKVSGIVGTHTHVQTNDARILPNGTAYLTDAGMTGPLDGIIGMRTEDSLNRFLTQLPTRMHVEENGRRQLNGCVIDIDENTGNATRIKTIQITP